MSTDQEYWDACLIRTWRKSGTLIDATSMFYSITGKKLDEAGILRIPRDSLSWKIGVRVFMANYLPKISDRLWSQPPEKDVELLRKLSKSKYNTEKVAYRTKHDKDLSNARRQMYRDHEKNKFEYNKVTNRNEATDWNVVKGPVRVRMKR